MKKSNKSHKHAKKRIALDGKGGFKKCEKVKRKNSAGKVVEKIVETVENAWR